MNKKEKLQQILLRLDAISKGGKAIDISSAEIESLTDRLIDEEMMKVTSKIKGDPIIKTLTRISSEIGKIKRDFNISSIIDDFKQFRSDLLQERKEISSDLEKKIKELKNELSDVNLITESKLDTVDKKVLDLQGELSKKKEDIVRSEDNLKKEISALSSKVLLIIESVKKVSGQNSSFQKEINDLRSDIYYRLASSGGGNANRQINVNSSVMSTKFTDINFQKFGNIGWSVTEDTDNKRVNIRASILAGGGGGSGTPGGNNTEVQYNDEGSFGASSTLTWNKNTSVLSVGQGILEGHALRADASDGILLKNNAGKDIALLGSSNTANATFYGPINVSSTLSVTGSASVKGKFSLGQSGSAIGILDIAGSTSQTIKIQTPSVAGGWTFTLPPNDGASGQYLLTDGNGITQWASVTAVGGSGITRSTSIITANTTGGTTVNTDYVYFANEGINFTLPTAISNANLYTIKNMGASSVLVSTSSGQTIDGSDTALMPTQYESLSFISNGSIWGVV